jgi:hypothetical protein
MTQFLVRHFDRVLIMLGLSLLIILSLKTLDNLANLAAVEAPQELRLDGGDLIALYTLNSGMNKPAILNRFGDALIEFSGWNSYVTVDGVTADLRRHAFRTELDRERNRAFLTWSSIPLGHSRSDGRRVRKYQIEQLVTLNGPTATVEYYVIPNEPVQRVQLVLGLFKWYFVDLKPSGDRLSFLSTDLNRQQAEERSKPRRLTPTAVDLWRSERYRTMSNEHGPFGVEVLFVTLSPKPSEINRIARIDVERAGEPR